MQQQYSERFKMSEHYDYDVVIIGAGISGLVCGCYLAKAGLKTLIVEKNPRPGGYCSSFTSKGFHFDAFAHSLSSLRRNGALNKICNDLDLSKRVRIKKNDPSEIFITPKHKICIFNDFDKTVNNFKENFPTQKQQLEDFFKFILFSRNDEFLKFKNKTFEQVMRSYFSDKQLIALLSAIMFLVVGVEPSHLSAVVAFFLWREFIFDGGYYPVGGMQSFANALMDRFKEFKGEIIIRNKVKKIIVTKNKAQGIILSDNKEILSNYVVSACDARQTFIDLVGKEVIGANALKMLKDMKASYSGFLIYLGLDKHMAVLNDLKANLYVLNSLDSKTFLYDFNHFRNSHFVTTSPTIKDDSQGKKISLCLTTNSIFKSINYWNNARKEEFANKIINLAEKIMPGLSKNIVFRAYASPKTLYQWTLNSGGSAYGWASTPQQFCNPEMSQRTKIKNLFLTGHWSNLSSGITFVATCGYDAADLILHNIKNK